jgi:hypothetical protein
MLDNVNQTDSGEELHLVKSKFEDMNQDQRLQLFRKAFLHTRRKLRNKIKTGKVETVNWLTDPPNHAFLRYLRRYVTIDKKRRRRFHDYLPTANHLAPAIERQSETSKWRHSQAQANKELQWTWHAHELYFQVLRPHSPRQGKKIHIQYLSPEIIKLLT